MIWGSTDLYENRLPGGLVNYSRRRRSSHLAGAPWRGDKYEHPGDADRSLEQAGGAREQER
jgi:hypothetical protein